MKKVILAIVLTLSGFQSFAQNGVGQPDPEAVNNSVRIEEIKEATRQQLEKVLIMVDKRNYSALAYNMIYAGPDGQRNLHTHLNYEDPFEKVTAENTLNRVKSWMEKAAIYHLDNFVMLPAIDAEYYCWEVEFASQRGKVVTHKFKFLNVGGRYLLASVE